MAESTQDVLPDAAREELERFRTEWQHALQQQRRDQNESGQGSRQVHDSKQGVDQHNADAPHGLDQAFSSLSVSGDAGTASSSTANKAAISTGIGNSGIESRGSIDLLTIQLEHVLTDTVYRYAEAVIEETQLGNLDQAIQLYRSTFRADPNIDRTFYNASLLAQDPEAQNILCRSSRLRRVADKVIQAVSGQPQVQKDGKRSLNDEPEKTANQRPVHSSTHLRTRSELGSGEHSGNANDKDVERIISAARVHRENRRIEEANKTEQERAEALHLIGNMHDFIRSDEETPCAIRKLPDDVLLLVLRHIASLPAGRQAALAIVHQRAARVETRANDTDMPGKPFARSAARRNGDTGHSEARRKPISAQLYGLDHSTLESLGRVCWKFRLLSLDAALWRLLVETTYRPPQILPDADDTVSKRYTTAWRKRYIHEPRVRMNGVYIASCRYTRPGVDEENVWVKVIHVIEFYRYLRFLPDGRCLSLRSTDAPTDTVRKIDPSMKLKGFAMGSWQLYPEGLPDDVELRRPPGPKVEITHLLDETMPYIRFRLILVLRSGGSLGKWNKMELLEYRSVNLRTGEDEPLSQKHDRPFFFSAVRSYPT